MSNVLLLKPKEKLRTKAGKRKTAAGNCFVIYLCDVA